MSDGLPDDKVIQPVNDSSNTDINTAVSPVIPPLNDDVSLSSIDNAQIPVNNLPDPFAARIAGDFLGGSKEGERVDRGIAEQKIEMEELGKEMEISKELEKMGVEKVPTEFPVPKEIKGFVEPLAGPATPIMEEPKIVNVPLKDDQIAVGIKQKITKSIRWLAEFCIKQIKKTHIKIKFVKGRLVRVMAG